jgi:hypothetical protein
MPVQISHQISEWIGSERRSRRSLPMSSRLALNPALCTPPNARPNGTSLNAASLDLGAHRGALHAPQAVHPHRGGTE